MANDSVLTQQTSRQGFNITLDWYWHGSKNHLTNNTSTSHKLLSTQLVDDINHIWIKPLCLDGLIPFTDRSPFLFLKLNVSHCAGKESISSRVWCTGVALHLSRDQFNQALNCSSIYLWVSPLKEIKIPS